MPPVNNQNPSSPTPNMYPTPHQGFDPTQPIVVPKKRMNPLIIPFILTLVFLLAAMGFGVWAFGSRSDYKNNSDQKAAKAVAAAEAKLSDAKEKEFAEREKSPYKEYKGPATFGSVDIQYPKTWGAFVTESDNAATPIDGYLHPNFVPGLQSGTAFALHFQVINTSYDQILKQFENDTKSGKVKVSPTSVPKVSGVAGVRIEGEVERGKQGALVLFPLRDKTLKITTEAQQFVPDFNNIILANLTFVP